MMNRFYQTLLILSTIGFSWLAMMTVHELGHVIHGCLSGGRLLHVELHPLAFSRTDFAVNPHPLFTAWGGVVWGILFPLLIWTIIHRFIKRYNFLAAFFAGFCLVANGAYLAGGSFLSGGADDAGVILQYGGAQWQLLLYGIPSVAAGLWCWNGLGPHFGLGPAHSVVDRSAAWAMTGLLFLIIIMELVL